MGTAGVIMDIFIPSILVVGRAYLLGLLAMIKCSICSYQYDH